MAEDQDKPASPETEGDKQGQPALDVIGAFGGIRPMATKLDIPVSTVQGWRERRVIPSSRHAQILEAALEHDIEVDPDVVAASAGRGEDGETEEGGTEALEKSGDTAAESPWKVGEGEAAEEKASEDSADRSGEEADSKPASEKQSESIPEALTEVAAAAAASAQVEAAPRRRSGVLTGLLLAVVLFVGGAVAAVVTKDQWEPLFGGAEDTVGPTLAALEGRVTELAEQLDGLSAGLAALQGAAQDQPAVDPAQIEALDAAVSSLAGGLRDLETAFGDLSSSQSAADTAGMPDISGLETRLSQLETNLESLASASAGASSEAGSGQPAADLGPLLARLTALESSLGEADLGQLDAVSALSSDAESTAERIAALEAQTSAAQTRVDELERTAAEAAANPPSLDGAASARHVALMLAVARLKDAVATTAPYSDQLASVGELFSDLEDAASPLAALAAGAETGMPTVEDLRSDFPVVARKIVAESAGGESDSWTAEVRRSLSSIVTLRRTGKIEGESADAIVARAEVEVGRGNLTAAVAELNALAGEKARAAADGWRSRAEQRLGADRAIERLAEMAIARIAGTGD